MPSSGSVEAWKKPSDGRRGTLSALEYTLPIVAVVATITAVLVLVGATFTDLTGRFRELVGIASATRMDAPSGHRSPGNDRTCDAANGRSRVAPEPAQNEVRARPEAKRDGVARLIVGL